MLAQYSLPLGEIISEIFDDLGAQEAPGDKADLLLSLEAGYHITDRLGLQVGTKKGEHFMALNGSVYDKIPPIRDSHLTPSIYPPTNIL